MRKSEDQEQFEIWVQMVRRNGLEPQIRESCDVAIQAYHANPGHQTMEYIAKLNPKAAEMLLRDR